MKGSNIIIAAMFVSLFASTAAMACNGPKPKDCECDQRTNTWVQTVTNNYNTNNNVNNSVNKSTNVNGVNGNVGSTSSASATGGTGGSVSGSGNSSNVNNVTGGNSSATIAKGAVTNTVNATTGASTSSANNNGNLSNVGSGNGSGNTTSASADGAGANSNNTNIVTTYKAAKIPVNTAYAAGLTSGIDTCLGSISGGAQTSFLGVSIGGTKRDKNCEHIKNTHLITEFSREAGCDYMLKNVQGASDAFKDVGATCVQPVVEATAVTALPLDAVTHKELNEVEKRIVTRIVQK